MAMATKTAFFIFLMICWVATLHANVQNDTASFTAASELDDPAPCGPCPDEQEPVCGANGVTYGNECVLECMGVAKWRDGPCAKNDCAIPKIKLPVCGNDGVTYINKWHAECNDAEIEFERACEDYE